MNIFNFCVCVHVNLVRVAFLCVSSSYWGEKAIYKKSRRMNSPSDCSCKPTSKASLSLLELLERQAKYLSNKYKYEYKYRYRYKYKPNSWAKDRLTNTNTNITSTNQYLINREIISTNTKVLINIWLLSQESIFRDKFKLCIKRNIFWIYLVCWFQLTKLMKQPIDFYKICCWLQCTYFNWTSCFKALFMFDALYVTAYNNVYWHTN